MSPKELDPAIERARELWSGGQPKAAVEVMAQRIEELNTELQVKPQPVPVRLTMPRWLNVLFGIGLLGALAICALYVYREITDDPLDRQLLGFCNALESVATDDFDMAAWCVEWREMVVSEHLQVAEQCADQHDDLYQVFTFGECLQSKGVPIDWRSEE